MLMKRTVLVLMKRTVISVDEENSVSVDEENRVSVDEEHHVVSLAGVNVYQGNDIGQKSRNFEQKKLIK